MKRILFSWILVLCATAVPNDRSMAASPDSPLNAVCNVNQRDVIGNSHSISGHITEKNSSICPTGPQGPAGAQGAMGPTGPSGSVAPLFGYFYTDNKKLSPPVINFTIDGPHSAGIERVTDLTFNKGATAIAIGQPGTYLVNFGLLPPTSGDVLLSLNGSNDASTRFFTFAIEVETIISIDAGHIAQGQGGAALLEVVAPNGLHTEPFPVAPGAVTAAISIVQLTSAPSEP